MRKPLFDDEIMEDEWEEVLKKLDKFFTGKEGKSEMDRICLQFDFHRFDEELKPMCEPIISNTIINSKSRYFKLFSLVFKYSSLKWYPKIFNNLESHTILFIFRLGYIVQKWV